MNPLTVRRTYTVKLLGNLVLKTHCSNRRRFRQTKKRKQLGKHIWHFNHIINICIANFIMSNFELYRIPRFATIAQLHITRLHDILERYASRTRLTAYYDLTGETIPSFRELHF